MMEETVGNVPAETTCKFCSNNSPGRYTCPRCNARYCSADCYKCEAHASCSESFYRDCFMEGLRDMETDPTQRQRIVEMLRRVENSDADVRDNLSEEEEEDLEERLEGINLDGSPDEIWNRLTESERREFDRLVNSGQLTDIIPLWTPWWSSASSKPLIEEISEVPSTVPKQNPVPKPLTKIPELASLSKSGVSELIPFSVVNMLYAYAYAARLYNGDHLAMGIESANVIMNVSESFARGIYSDTATAITSCVTRLESDDGAREHFVSREYSVAVIRDVCEIISGPSDSRPLEYVIAALSDCHAVFKKARQDVVKTSAEKDSSRVYFCALKKLEFVLSWVVAQGSVLRSLLPSVELEACELSTQLSVHRCDKERVKRALRQKKIDESRPPLISEIS